MKTPAATRTRRPDPKAPARKKILLVDDHPFMRAGLAQLIDLQPDMAVAGEAGDPAEALQKFSSAKPDLVLTDMTMPGRSGLEFIKDLRAADPGVAILVVSMHDEVIYAERALRAGARAAQAPPSRSLATGSSRSSGSWARARAPVTSPSSSI